MRRVIRGSLFVACVGVINLASVIGIPARGDVVTDWNNAALDAIRADRTAPPIASRSLAIVHVAIYDAVNGIARTHEPYLVPSAVSASASRVAAASAAAHQTLVSLFPSHTSTFNGLHATILAGIPNGPQKTNGITWGEFVATQILAARANDGSNADCSATWRQWSWCLDSYASGVSSLFVAAMGIRRAVCNEQQLAVSSAGTASSR